jgi:IS5 family transposase
VKYSKAKARADGTKPIDIAIPIFGYKSHVSIDRMHGIIRRQIVTNAGAHDGARLREGLIQTANNARDDEPFCAIGSSTMANADSAYRLAENEAWLAAQGMKSQVHRKKPRGRPMPRRTSRANGRKSAVRAKVEHIFAQQKDRMGLTIGTIGLARTRATITLANMVYNTTRLRWLLGQPAPA